MRRLVVDSVVLEVRCTLIGTTMYDTDILCSCIKTSIDGAYVVVEEAKDGHTVIIKFGARYVSRQTYDTVVSVVNKWAKRRSFSIVFEHTPS